MKSFTMQLTTRQTGEIRQWWDNQGSTRESAPEGGFFVLGQARVKVAGFYLSPATAEFLMVSPECGREIQAALDRELKRVQEARAAAEVRP